MGRTYEEIGPELAAWIAEQKIYFVATAPLAADGLVNCSPKGMDSFRILGPKSVAYLDLTGSGAETIAHLRENGRIVVMFCAFAGPPKIVRLHGVGRVLTPRTEGYECLREQFPDHPGERAVIQVDVTRVSGSCGYSVPKFDFTEDRDALVRWAEAKGEDGLAAYRRQKNAKSIDGLPALDADPEGS